MSDSTNEAIDRLARALYELSYRSKISISPEVRLLLCPGEQSPEAPQHTHSIGFTAQTADLVADAVERLLATGDRLSDAFSAYVFAMVKPDLASEIRKAFDGIDTKALARTVLDDTHPAHHAAVRRALDEMFRPRKGDEQEDGDDA